MILTAAVVIGVGALITKAIEKIGFVDPSSSQGVAEQVVDPGFMDAVLLSFTKLFAGPLMDNTQYYAFSLFKILLGLDFVLAIIMGLVAFEAGPNFLTLFINKIFKYGFWTWIVYNWRAITDSILQGFVQIGTLAPGAIPKDIMYHPSFLITMGYNLSSSYLSWMTNFRVSDILVVTWVFRAIIALIAAIFIFVSFALIALNLFLTTIEYNLCICIMLIFLPFAVFDKTERYASQAFSMVISAGTRYMVFCVLVSMIYAYFSEDQATFETLKPIFHIKGDNPSMVLALFACFLSGTMAYLCCEAPQMAASAISGALHLDSNNAIMHGIGAAGIAGKGVNAVGNAGATVGGAAMRAKDAYSAAQSANAAAVKAGGSVSALSPMGAAAKGFAAGLGSGALEATFGGMEEAKRVGGAASGRKTSSESLNDKGELGKSATVTRDSAGNAISKSVNQDYTSNGEKNGSSKSGSSGSNGNSGGSGGSSYVPAPTQGGSSSASSGVSQEGQRGPQGDFGH